MQRAQKIRMIGLAGAALLAIAVPLGAAMAGPAGTAAPGTGPGEAAKAENSSTEDKGGRGESGTKPGSMPLAAVGSTLGSTGSPGSSDRPALPHLSGRTSRCGPELTAPQGIEAQTCVLAEDGLTWGRTYYRNRTGDRLRAVLTLLRPDDRTVQVNCEVPAGGAPGVCETPSAPTVHRSRLPYTAVAEIADASGERLLLRSGSNSSAGESGSDH
ncbi:hypothetical protein ACGFWI_03425 [Streptomyces sp. NPDC048434]|uniref:hypothetical protein n=1 Tax=Streptomyces sp. NPDC048434 TaxID=3365549 RepID=UPI0037235C57